MEPIVKHAKAFTQKYPNADYLDAKNMIDMETAQSDCSVDNAARRINEWATNWAEYLRSSDAQFVAGHRTPCIWAVFVGRETERNRVESAAPELLAALEGLVADFGSDYAGPTLDAARVAIAKAKG